VPPTPIALAEFEAPPRIAEDLRILNAIFAPLYARHPEVDRADRRLQQWLVDLLGFYDRNTHDAPRLLDDLSDETQWVHEQVLEGQVLVVGRKDGTLFVRYPRATGWVYIGTLCARCGRAPVYPIVHRGSVFCSPVCREGRVSNVLLRAWLRTLNRALRSDRDGIRAAVEERGEESWAQWLKRCDFRVSGTFDIRCEVHGVAKLPGLDWPATSARQHELEGSATYAVVLVGGLELQRERFDDWRVAGRAA
jgi:hypothetical protein